MKHDSKKNIINLKSLLISLLAVMSLFLFSACGSVKRIDPAEQVDLSGKWNDTDSRLVSEEMIKDATKHGWIRDFSYSKSRNPVVIVGEIRNMTHEHISTETFTKDLERALLNSGMVDFVAAKNERDEIREERKDQAKNAMPSTVKRDRRETGADFILSGTINSIVDRATQDTVIFYQVNLEIISIESNKKVWIGEKKIKKRVKWQKVSY